MTQTEEVFPLPKSIVGDGHLFLLKVQGNAYSSTVIVDGDWVVVRSQDTAGPGDIVAVMSRGDAVLRAYPDWDGSRETLIGKAVSVLHRL